MCVRRKAHSTTHQVTDLFRLIPEPSGTEALPATTGLHDELLNDEVSLVRLEEVVLQNLLERGHLSGCCASRVSQPLLDRALIQATPNTLFVAFPTNVQHVFGLELTTTSLSQF
jgi:hypothetical protein